MARAALHSTLHQGDAAGRWLWLLNCFLGLAHAFLAFRLGRRRPVAPVWRVAGLAAVGPLLAWSFTASRSLPRSRQILRTVRLSMFIISMLLEGRYPSRRKLFQVSKLAAGAVSTLLETRIAPRRRR